MTTREELIGKYKDNPSARHIVLQAYRNALKDGKSVGWRSEHFTELTGIGPVDEKSDTDYGNEYVNSNNE